jgi:LacI family transcriptional regulator
MKAEEVARLGGVSRSTVSRVINNYSNVPEETREKVLRVVRETNYVPNTSARILAGKGTDTIGLFIFNVHDDTRPGRIYGNSYFGPFVNAVVDRCNNRGYSVLIHTLYRSKDCRRIPTAWNEKRIDGAIIIGTERDEDIERLIAQTDCPLAIADYNPKTVARLAAPTARLLTVNSDDDAGMEACVRHLAERRLKAFKGSMKTLGLTVRAKWMPHGDFSYRRTAEAVQAMIADGKLPTALIASNDDMALAAIETFRNAGIQVPEDISVIGYDDGLAAPLVHPALTTVRVPFFDMASRAVEGLVKLLEGGKPAVESATLPVTLVRRATCGAPRAHQVMTREPSQA